MSISRVAGLESPTVVPADADHKAAAWTVPTLSSAGLVALRAVLIRSGYMTDVELGPSRVSASLGTDRRRLEPLKRLLSGGETLATAEAEKALFPLNLAVLREGGLLGQAEGRVRARFQIQAYNGLLFIVDFMPPEHPPDLVLPVGPSGKYLASLTIRQAVDCALDLGCGCGIQALLLAQHARLVTATDINPRALGLTRLNARFNGFSNVEVVEGSYFEPLKGRKFDLVVANLPYVLNPDNQYVYRDLGTGGHTRIQETVQEMPQHLNEGGYAHMLINWIHRADEPWWQPVEEWTSRSNVDSWMIYSRSDTPEVYAKTWILTREQEHPEEYARTKTRWLNWYEAQGIERIAFGALTLRRRTSQGNWRCSVRVTQIAHEPLGGQILRLFRNQDFLGRLGGPQDLLEMILRPSCIQLEAWSPGIIRARSSRYFLMEWSIHPLTAATVAQLDGRTILKRVISKSVKVERLSSMTVMGAIADEIYQLMNLGLIEPA